MKRLIWFKQHIRKPIYRRDMITGQMVEIIVKDGLHAQRLYVTQIELGMRYRGQRLQ